MRTIDRIKGYRILLTLAPLLFVADQLSKYWIANLSGLQLHAYPPFGGIEVLPPFFNIVYAVNYGAAWGILAGRGYLLLLIAGLALSAIYIFRNDLELRRPPMQVAFGLIIGGILGNSYDRLVHGHVIDFIDIHLQFYRWPTFNFADMGIVAGTLFYILLTLRASK
ncbi:MAG: signal peptidase II [Verrucomicrobia bacterium]|nr:signal peptidase II [Verrucomicrobiota bacterium]